MYEFIYTLGVVSYLAYKCARLEASVIRSNLKVRFSASIFNSLLWFIYLPIEFFSGRLFLVQMEYDRLVFDKIIKEQIEEAIKDAKSKFADMGEVETEILRGRLQDGIGTLDDALNDCTYFSISISKYQLAGLISYYFSQTDANQIDLIEQYEKVTPTEFVEQFVHNIPTLTEIIKKDLLDFSLDDGYTSIKYNGKSPFHNLLGFRTNYSGLTYYGTEVKSKDTIPFFCIIYYDGMSLRAFVPSHNLYNKETTQPFGADEEADVVFLEDSLDDVCLKSSMYRLYTERINVETTREQIEVTVNYIQLTSQPPRYGWQDINVKK